MLHHCHRDRPGLIQSACASSGEGGGHRFVSRSLFTSAVSPCAITAVRHGVTIGPFWFHPSRDAGNDAASRSPCRRSAMSGKFALFASVRLTYTSFPIANVIGGES